MASKISIQSVVPEHQLILQESVKIINTLTDVSKYALAKGAATINYPTLAAGSAEAIAIGASFTDDDANYADEILSLDIKLGRSFKVNVHAEQQNAMNAVEDSTKQALLHMGLKADASCYAALLASVQAAGENVPKTSDMYADLVDIQKKMNDNKVPMTNRFLLVNTTDWATLLKTKDFVQFQSTGSGQPIVDGVIGRILGFQVVLSTVVSGDSIAYHSNALAYAFQGNPIMLENVDTNGTVVKYSVSEMFGCKATQGGNLAVRYGANPA